MVTRSSVVNLAMEELLPATAGESIPTTDAVLEGVEVFTDCSVEFSGLGIQRFGLCADSLK